MSISEDIQLSNQVLRQTPDTQKGSDEDKIHNYIIGASPIPSNEVINKVWGSFKHHYTKSGYLVTPDDRKRFNTVNNIYINPTPHFSWKKKIEAKKNFEKSQEY